MSKKTKIKKLVKKPCEKFTEDELRSMKFIIGDNNCGCDTICGVCGRLFEPDIGFILWTREERELGQLVCDGCTEKYSEHSWNLIKIGRILSEIRWKTWDECDKSREELYLARKESEENKL